MESSPAYLTRTSFSPSRKRNITTNGDSAMRCSRLASVLSLAILSLLIFGTAIADKNAEILEFKDLVHQEYLAKPWQLSAMTGFNAAFADVTETEPNNACPGNALNLNNTFHGELNPGGDVDWVSFFCDAGGIITIGTDADGGLPTVDTFIELYEDDCITLLASNDDGGPGLYSLISGLSAPYTGTYHLKVRGFSSFSTGNYIVQGSCTVPQPGDETEPNNTCPGEPYTLGDQFNAAITPGGDEDWIHFDCNAGQLITMGTFEDAPLPTVDTKIELFEDDCTTLLASNDDGGPGLYSLIAGVVAPYTGTYHLRIFGFGSTSEGNYILVGNCEDPPDSDELPNDSCPGQQYVLGTDFHGAVDPAGDLDWIFFECAQGDLIDIGTNPDGALQTVDTVIELYESDCTTLIDIDDDGGPGLYSSITVAAPYTGTYHLKIRGFSSFSSTGNYLLLGTCNAPPENDVCETATPITRCVDFTDAGNTGLANNDYTPSDDVAGTGCTGFYAQGGDLVYRLDMNSGDQVHIEYFNASDASVYIVTDCADAQNTCVAGADNTFSNSTEVLDFVAPADGVYFLILDTFSAFTPGGAFTVSVDWVVCETPNCPRSVGFWGRQALQRGNGSTKFNMAEMEQIASCVDDVSDFFDWADSDFNQFLVTILPAKHMDIRKQAKRQYAGVLANFCTGAIGLIASNGDEIGLSLTAPLSCAGLGASTVGELIVEAGALLAALESQNLNDPAVIAQYEDVKDCLDAVNNGNGIGPVCVEVETNAVMFYDDDDLLRLATDVETGIVPTRAKIYPARPSPFEISTRFAYAVPAGGAYVELEVFNLAGQRVRTLESSTMPAGIHQVDWDGRNSSGVPVPASVYFFRVNIGGQAHVTRVVRLR